MESLEQRLRHQAMSWLAQREFSRHELSEKLQRKFFAPRRGDAADKEDVETTSRKQSSDLIDATLIWLEARQFLSDERCARLYVRSHIERGHGPLRIRQELVFQKGLNAELVESALQAIECDWQLLATDILAKRFRGTPTSVKEKARQLRFLQQRGFTSDQCYRALSSRKREI